MITKTGLICNYNYLLINCVAAQFNLKSIQFMMKKRRQFHPRDMMLIKLMANKDTIYYPKIRNTIITYIIPDTQISYT